MKQIWELIESASLAEAEALCGQALRNSPGSLEAQFALSVCHYKQGRLEAALAQAEQVLAVEPKAFSVLTLASRILYESRRFESALEYSRQALAIKPADVAVLLMVGKCLTGVGRWFEALQAFDAVVQLEPRQPGGFFGMADVFGQIGSSFDAAEALSRGLEFVESRSQLIHLAETELGIGRTQHALNAAQRVLRMDLNDLTANLLAARCLTELGDLAAADHHWHLARKHSDSAWRVSGQKGYALSVTGRFDESEASLKESITLRPDQGAAYQMLFSIRKVEASDRQLIEYLMALSEDPKLDPAEVAPLHFALAKGHDDLGNPATAMLHYNKANARRLDERRLKAPFLPEVMEDQCAALRRLFSEPFPSREGPPSAKPIFVVGMMRSGTSLLEQVLSAHPLVVGAGELDFWPGSETLMIDPATRALRTESVFERRAAYLRLLASFGKDPLRVVDKNPANLLSAGLIHRVFPDSPIICIRRKPIDTALSIWTTDASAPFMADKTSIVTAITLAIAQASHWRRTIPDNRWYELTYEEFVENPERMTRSILEFCDLPWDDACLSPHRSRTRVNTPSVWQARQEIYISSVDRWKRFEPWLGEFRELLDLEWAH